MSRSRKDGARRPRALARVLAGAGAAFAVVAAGAVGASPATAVTGAMHVPASGTVTGKIGDPRPGHKHRGIDIAAAAGTRVDAAYGGVVTVSGYDSEVGYNVAISHGQGFVTKYYHLNGQPLVDVGDRVRTEQQIGRVGDTGTDSRGNHLHFETWRSGVIFESVNDYFIRDHAVTRGNPIAVDFPNLPTMTPANSHDFSGDARSDVFALQPDGDFYLYRGNGAAGWSGAGTKIGGGWQRFDLAFNAGDFSGDGNSDIIAREPDGSLFLYRGNGAGGWVDNGRQIGRGWDIYDTVFGPGDFTGDESPDVMARKPNGDLYLYKGDGAGGWASAGLKIGSGWQMYDTVFSPGDFTGGGYADVMARTPGGDLYLYKGNGKGGWGSAGIKVGTGWQMFDTVFSPGDFSGGGYPDVMARKPNGDLFLYKGDGSGGWGSAGIKVGSGWQGFRTVF